MTPFPESKINNREDLLNKKPSKTEEKYLKPIQYLK